MYDIKGSQLVDNRWVPLKGEYSFDKRLNLWNNKDSTLPEDSFIIKTPQSTTLYYVHIKHGSLSLCWAVFQIKDNELIYSISTPNNTLSHIDELFFLETDQVDILPIRHQRDRRPITPRELIKKFMISDDTIIPALTGLVKLPKTAQDVLDHIDLDGRGRNIEWLNLIQHRLSKEDFESLQNNHVFISALLTMELVDDSDIVYVAKLLPLEEQKIYWESKKWYTKQEVKKLLKGKDLFNFYAVTGHLSRADFLRLHEQFTEDEIKSLMKFTAVQEAISTFEDRSNPVWVHTLSLIYDRLPAEHRLDVIRKIINNYEQFEYIQSKIAPDDIEAFILDNVDMAARILDNDFRHDTDNIINLVNETHQLHLIVKMLEKTKHNQKYLLNKIPDDMLFSCIINNKAIIDRANGFLGSEIHKHAVSHTQDKAKQAELALVFIENAKEDYVIRNILNSVSSRLIIDKIKSSAKAIDAILKVTHQGDKQKLYNIIINISDATLDTEHKNILSFPGMDKGIYENIKTYYSYMEKFLTKDERTTHLFSPEFIAALKNSLTSDFSLRSFDKLIENNSTSTLFYDHIISNIMSTDLNATELCWFMLYHLQDKKSANWLELVANKEPNIFTNLLSQPFYKHIDINNRYDAVMIKHIIIKQFNIPLKDFHTEYYTPFDYSSVAHIHIHDKETGCMIDYLDHLTPVIAKTHRLRTTLDENEENTFAQTSGNIHVLDYILSKRKNDKSDATIIEQALERARAVRDLSDEAFIEAYITPTPDKKPQEIPPNFVELNPVDVRYRTLYERTKSSLVTFKYNSTQGQASSDSEQKMKLNQN